MDCTYTCSCDGSDDKCDKTKIEIMTYDEDEDGEDDNDG